jgi:hypothetical protein
MRNFLQCHFNIHINPHPPSSGFLAIILASHWCASVSALHFHLAWNHRTPCYYFGCFSSYSQCYTAHYHPLFFEKTFFKSMHNGSMSMADKQITLVNSTTLLQL